MKTVGGGGGGCGVKLNVKPVTSNSERGGAIPTIRRGISWLYYSGQDIPLSRNRPPSYGGLGMWEARV